MMNRVFLAMVLMLSLAPLAPAKAPDEGKVQDRLQSFSAMFAGFPLAIAWAR